MSTTRSVAKNSLAKNTVALYIAQIVMAAQGIVIAILIARHLGDVNLGKYTFGMSFTILFAAFIDLGFPTVIIREVARDKPIASKYLGNIIIMQVFLSVILFGLLAITIKLMAYPNDTVIIVLILGLYQIFNASSVIFQAAFTAFERMEYVALAQFIASLITTALALVASLILGYGLVAIACTVLIGGFIQLLVSFFICSRKIARPEIKFDINFSKNILKMAIPLTILTIASILYIRISAVMVSVMKGDEAVGWLSAAYSIVFMLTPIAALYVQAVLPRMSIDAISSIDSLKRSVDRTMRFTITIGLPLAVGTALVADRIIPLLFGQEFNNSIIVLQIMAVYVFFAFLYIPLANILVAMNKQNSWIILACIGAILEVILNLALIPHFSYTGAALAFAITGAVLFAPSFYLVSRYLHRPPLLRIIGGCVIACTAMVLFIHFCPTLNVILVILLGAFIYFALLFVTNYKEMQFIRKGATSIIQGLKKR